jgi:Tfp pilus assembly protein PilF
MPSAHLQLANLYLKRYEMAAASSELQACLRANPSDPQAPAIKKMWPASPLIRKTSDE